MNLSPSTNKIFDIFSQVLNFISVELNRFAKKTSSLKRDGDHAISHQEKHRLPKGTARFPVQK